MKSLGIDPSSTRTGYALVERSISTGGAVVVVEGGYLRPKKQSDSPIVRIQDMVCDLGEMIDDFNSATMPAVVVVEITSGKAGRGFRLGAGPHLAVYGMAVGAVYITCLHHLDEVITLIDVDERTWTQGVPKAKRQQMIAAEFPAYREQMVKDSGGDVADAIGLALWGLSHSAAP